jgi:hypothetical protein
VVSSFKKIPALKMRLPLNVEYTNEGDEGIDAGGLGRVSFFVFVVVD